MESDDKYIPRLLRTTSFALVALGLASRIAPLFNHQGRVFWQFPTEDGYLMLTIARNLALGKGMSTAAGELPTNGTQPLFNLIEAGFFWLTGGSRFWGVWLSLLLSVIIAAAGAWLLYRIARELLAEQPFGQPLALFAGAVWLASPQNMGNTMNCLETGLYQTLGLASFWAWFRFTRAPLGARTWLRTGGLGALFGLTFLARIDAVFLILSLTCWHVGAALVLGFGQLGRRLGEATVMGLCSIVVGSPWLIHNFMGFGSLMPVSGTAQAHGAGFANNIREVPFKLFEYMSVVVPVPQALEASVLALTLTSLFVLSYAAFFFVVLGRLSSKERLLPLAAVTYAVLLVTYYGLYFGAAHFVGRYLSPISPWTALLTAWLLLEAVRRSAGVLRTGVLHVALGVVTILSLVLNVRWYLIGERHMHAQVVDYVQENVPDELWVGAVQTGTLGFFHDRTINLDGKVNPEALVAVLSGTIPEYVTSARFGEQQRPIEYIVDWQGVSAWAEKSPLDCHFELIVNDKERNLSVLKRDAELHRTREHCRTP